MALRYFNKICEGDDANTNSSVVDAFLGAQFGYNKIPKELNDYKFVGQLMYREIISFMEFIGLEMIPSSYI